MTVNRNIPKLAKSLTQREGKVLRYVCSVGVAIHPSMTVNTIEWSDLPHSLMQATRTLHSLLAKGLVERDTDGSGIDFGHTKLGTSVVSYADKNHMWQTPPPPSVTRPRRRK